MALGAFAISLKGRLLNDFAGVGREAPWSAVALAVAVASLAGVPLTMGFLGKWSLIGAALEAGQAWVVVVFAVGSLLTLVYVGRIVEVIFFRSPAPGAPRAKEAPVGVLAPLWVLAGLSIWFGIDATLPASLADASAAALLGGGR